MADGEGVAVGGDRKPGVEIELWLENYHPVRVLSLLNPTRCLWARASWARDLRKEV